jgi:hypothetical protein
MSAIGLYHRVAVLSDHVARPQSNDQGSQPWAHVARTRFEHPRINQDGRSHRADGVAVGVNHYRHQAGTSQGPGLCQVLHTPGCDPCNLHLGVVHGLCHGHGPPDHEGLGQLQYHDREPGVMQAVGDAGRQVTTAAQAD